LFGAVAAFSIPSLVAQAPQDSLHAPSGDTRLMVQSIAVPPLTNVPFTATVSTTWVRLFDDGSSVTIQNHRTIARDNLGRVYQQRRNLYPEGDPRENEIRQIEISDPQTHEIYFCHPIERRCELRIYYPLTSPAAVIPAGPLNGGKAFLTRAPLGNDSVSGVETVGTRETTTLNAGSIGNDRSISIVKEFWYSPQLGINLIEKRQDPRVGTQTFTVSDISLGEPDARLFETPAGFQTIDMRKASPAAAQNAGNN
ncbi:MAG TPA: hypothetical protein VGJ09_01485, partial [Bryobacteraceae bacterium]